MGVSEQDGDLISVRKIDLLCEIFAGGFMTELSLFEKWTERRRLNDGRYRIKCKKGNWSVEAPNKSQATQEAMHYFIQYFQDGEYT